MKSIVNDIMAIMDTIDYGFPDENGHNLMLSNPQKFDQDFDTFYYLLTPQELLEKKYGVCWDQVELERQLFEKHQFKVQTYFIYIADQDNLPSHTFLTYQLNNQYYWFEHSWATYKGIHQYKSQKELLLDVKKKFINSHPDINHTYTFVYQYLKPKAHITCQEFYQYCETQELIYLNKPLYFYHLVDKKANLNNGLISLQYMYEHQLFDLFDKYTSKYRERIVSVWSIAKYKGRNPNSLTREEIINALNIFRGPYGTSYIYFFKYPPFKQLGPRMKAILEYKDIYRININNEQVQKNIIDIFYGYNQSHSDQQLLTKEYYEHVSKEEYFKNYNDNISMNYSTLNHISIAFKNNHCLKEFLEKIT